MAVAGDEQVLGLQVPVHDPVLVRGGEAPHDLQRVVERAVGGQGGLGEPRAQRLPLEQLRDDVVGPALLSDVVDGDDVRVVEAARRPRLELEAPAALLVAREPGREDLDRHLASQPGVARTEHLAHAARPEGGEDLVRAEAGSGGERHSPR